MWHPHSYASADKTYYVKLLCKSFNINDLQAARAAAEPCKPAQTTTYSMPQSLTDWSVFE